MKRITNLIWAVSLLSAASAQATLYTYTYNSGFAGGGVIPDGNVAGWSDSQTISGLPTLSGDNAYIIDVNVRLEISGTYNGDLYGYLVHSSGFTVLLNRIGRTSGNAFGDGGDGMNITLSDGASDIHGASGALSGTWAPDGRNVDPASVLDTDPRQNSGNPLGVFNGMDANGSWTLFLADMAGGDQSTLVSWGLDLEVVPEPITWALALFGGVLGAIKLGHHWRRRK